MSIIETKKLAYYYQDGDMQRYILRDISVSFEKGKIYTIVGESGSGKTTLLAMIAGLDGAKDGQVLFEGKDIKEIGLDKYRRNKVSIIFQNNNLVPYLTAVENVLVAMDITDNPLPSDKKVIAYNLLDYIGITHDKADRLVSGLSGGEQQRIVIARALATNSDVILADEPTGSLDEARESEIVAIFQRLAHEDGKAVIMVTHSQEVAAKSDVTYRLKKGNLRQED
ncbi:ABC transporter ATP-binding protein [Lactococcus piscium]|uniref:ABC transporter n=1 Tax=Pseudolactococcus paracarnosus TaxID=2749962 RepID=A0A7L4WDM3_9LACT|nr:ABC transporter ATP-binding protein [Lactococcus paracarnosus]MCJ1994749.1 ABC transporter ATP-binding protein [Lactococcus paracarnosus]QDJ27563.1 ABC transporter [Lactococcus paracarnosus]SPC36335.1 putative ABC transporter (ATPase component) [Lactococcus piscium]